MNPNIVSSTNPQAYKTGAAMQHKTTNQPNTTNCARRKPKRVCGRLGGSIPSGTFSKKPNLLGAQRGGNTVMLGYCTDLKRRAAHRWIFSLRFIDSPLNGTKKND